MDKKLLERYAQLKQVVKEAEKELKEMNPQIREQMAASNTDEAETSFGKFYFSVTPMWTYPADIVLKQQEVEKLEEEAKQKGTATYIDRRDLKFSPKKSVTE